MIMVLIEGIIDTAHVFGIEVIAEGVGTEDQVSILEKIGCDIIIYNRKQNSI